MKLEFSTGRVLVFGGCYSNLQATEALLAEAARRGIGPERMICTGDMIAYGADAAATFRLVRAAGIVSIAGNCEESLSEAAADCGCGFAPGSACEELAVTWYAHAAAQVDDDDRRAMAALPRRVVLRLGDKRFAVLHGNAERINAFVFPSVSNLELARQIALTGCDGVIAGHCGIPFTRRVGDGVWHNAGSIGMPANDGTPRGWFSVLQVDAGDIVISSHALEYDFAGAARAMRRSGLPEGYARGLESGIWPSLDILPAAERLRTGVALEVAPPVEPAPVVALERLETLWVNTGTLCNLSCTLCFMESAPSNDSLAYFSVGSLQEILREAPAGLREVGFTGGEPFMNPDIIAMLEAVLTSGRRALVLTNAMRPMRRVERELVRLIAEYPGLAFRVSLDHYLPGRHEALRGAGSFAPSVAGLKFLEGAGAEIAVAARTPWGETEAMMRGGFGRLFAAHEVALDADDPARLILFPEMDVASPALPVTVAALAAVPEEKKLMCATSRMVVQRKGERVVSFTPCTLLPGQRLGADFAASQVPVVLGHAHCAQFCVYGGASCAGAPG